MALIRKGEFSPTAPAPATTPRRLNYTVPFATADKARVIVVTSADGNLVGYVTSILSISNNLLRAELMTEQQAVGMLARVEKVYEAWKYEFEVCQVAWAEE